VAWNEPCDGEVSEMCPTLLLQGLWRQQCGWWILGLYKLAWHKFQTS